MAGHIVALGGGGFSMEPDNLTLDRYILSLWHDADREPRVCFIPPEHSDDYIHRFYSAFETLPCRPTHWSLAGSETSDPIAVASTNDIFYVGGGNTRKMLAIWREHGLDRVLKEAWQSGKILCGVSAGAICWFEQAISDSVVEGELHPLNCLGFLSGTGRPHYDEHGRRETFHRCLGAGGVSAGYGIDNRAALHFQGTKLVNVVTSRPAACAYHVALKNGQVAETVVRPEPME